MSTIRNPLRSFAATLIFSFILVSGATAQGRGGPPGSPPVSGIDVNGRLGPVVKDGIMQPVAEFADTSQIIRQSLWVETNFDSDRDGRLDRVHVQVTRPGAAEKAGLKIPALMLSSPYIGPTNGNSPDWDVNQETPNPCRLMTRERAPAQAGRLLACLHGDGR